MDNLVWLELLVYLILFVGGFRLVFMSMFNKMRLAWGMLMLFLSITMAADSLVFTSLNPGEMVHRHDLLFLPHQIQMSFVAASLGLVLLASLRPGWVTPGKILLFYTPSISVLVMTICFLWFGGELTHLWDTEDIFRNIGNSDVQFRIFAMSVMLVSTLIMIYYPFVSRGIEINRRRNKWTFFFIFGATFLAIFYSYHSLHFNFLVNVTVSLFIAVFLITCTALFYIYENPFSLPPTNDKVLMRDDMVESRFQREGMLPVGLSNSDFILSKKLKSYLVTERPFLSPGFNIDEASEYLKCQKLQLSKVIKSEGFTSWSEYLNFLRFEYLKALARKSPTSSLQYLIQHSGFTSRASFYRYYNLLYSIPAAEYVRQLHENQEPEKISD